jgi:TetR/AcrR family transcriptional regulator, regulator of cefoperazone and chloramphenicol sensitivity
VKPDRATRARLLAAGEQLFAERGFKKVTVREICRAARANVAAVNYHFGDKLGLYREVLQSAIERMRATNAAARRAGEGRGPEERLRRAIHVFVARILGAQTDTVHRLIQREATDPTPVLDALVEEALRPRVDYLAALVADLIGTPKSDPRVLRCVASIQTQLTAYFPHPITTRLGFALPPTTPAGITTIAEHVADFSLAGVRAMARRSRRRGIGRVQPPRFASDF